MVFSSLGSDPNIIEVRIYTVLSQSPTSIKAKLSCKHNLLESIIEISKLNLFKNSKNQSKPELFHHVSYLHLSNLPFLGGNKGGKALLFI